MFLDFYRLAERVRARLFTTACRTSFRALGAGSSIVPPARIRGEKGIEVGRGVHFGASCWLEVLEGSGSAAAIRIGDGTSFAGYCTITAAESVVIGRNVLVARYVHISDHRHAFGNPTVAVKDQGIDRIRPVTIGDGAWLGQGVVVCPGVSIGRNAVVGANSVVKSDIPDHCVAAGSPAVIVRRPETAASREGAAVG